MPATIVQTPAEKAEADRLAALEKFQAEDAARQKTVADLAEKDRVAAEKAAADKLAKDEAEAAKKVADRAKRIASSPPASALMDVSNAIGSQGPFPCHATTLAFQNIAKQLADRADQISGPAAAPATEAAK